MSSVLEDILYPWVEKKHKEDPDAKLPLHTREHKRVYFLKPNASSSINVLEDELMSKLPAALVVLAAKVGGEDVWKVLKEYIVVEAFLDERTKRVLRQEADETFEDVKRELTQVE